MGRRASVEPSSTVFDKYRARTYLREKLLAVFIGCSLFFSAQSPCLHQAITPSVKTYSCFCGAHSAWPNGASIPDFLCRNLTSCAALRTLTKRYVCILALEHKA